MEENNNSIVEKSTPEFPCSLIYPRYCFPFSIVLPRSSHDIYKIIPKNNMYTSINKTSEEENMEITQFKKSDYVKIVQEKRKNFVHTHFGRILKELFEKLEEEAVKMRNCHHEAVFECPEYFDVDKTESVIREYFKDIGFETIATPRKEDISTIILTIT